MTDGFTLFPLVLARIKALARLLGDLVHALGEVLDVLGSDTSHGDAAVLGHVDVELGAEALDLVKA